MDSQSPHRTPENMVTRQQMERIEEPWFLNKAVAVVIAFLLAIVLGYLGASGDVETLVLVAIWIVAVGIIVFVKDYWWTPALIITALSFHTYALGFSMTGLEVGIFILALTFPVKLAMKTLRPAAPTLRLDAVFWALLGYLVLHFVIIFFYSKIEGVQLKNIVKSYYRAITPLVYYGLLMRYCDTKTVRPSAIALFMTTLGVAVISLPIIFLNIPFQGFLTFLTSVDWLSARGAAGVFRSKGLLLMAGALAWWPVARAIWVRPMLLAVMVIAFVGTGMGGSRISFMEVMLSMIAFSVFRRKIWAAVLGAAFIGGLSLFITADPNVLYNFPDMVHRSLVPLNFSGEVTEWGQDAEGSDVWHNALRSDSIGYWLADANSIFFGHGYKTWDDQNKDDPDFFEDFELMKQYAIEMGATENMFSSITNVFGLVGILLYLVFLGGLTLRLWKAMQVTPLGGYEHALCEFSLVNVGLTLLFTFHAGGAPGLEIVYWSLGLLAARPFIGEIAPKQVPVRESFDRAHEIPVTPARPPAGRRNGSPAGSERRRRPVPVRS